MSKKDKKWKLALSTGLAGGILWGLVSLVVYYLQFTDIAPSFYAKPFLDPDYEYKWQGQLIGIAFFILYVLIASFFYAAFLIKYPSPWVGIFYGLAWWGIVFFLLSPLFELAEPVGKLGINTNSVMISLYLLLGLFVGYSLSAEFNNQDQS